MEEGSNTIMHKCESTDDHVYYDICGKVLFDMLTF